MNELKLDWEHLQSVSQGDREVMKEVVQIYLEEGPRMEADLQLALDSGEPERVRSTAHRLLGALQIVGGRPWVAAIRPLEQVQDSQQLAAARERMAELTPQIGQLNKQLAGFVRDGIPPPG